MVHCGVNSQERIDRGNIGVRSSPQNNAVIQKLFVGISLPLPLFSRPDLIDTSGALVSRYRVTIASFDTQPAWSVARKATSCSPSESSSAKNAMLPSSAISWISFHSPSTAYSSLATPLVSSFTPSQKSVISFSRFHPAAAQRHDLRELLLRQP